jgi:hypothetical protein
LPSKHTRARLYACQVPKSDVASAGVKTIPFQVDFRDRLQHEGKWRHFGC